MVNNLNLHRLIFDGQYELRFFTYAMRIQSTMGERDNKKVSEKEKESINCFSTDLLYLTTLFFCPNYVDLFNLNDANNLVKQFNYKWLDYKTKRAMEIRRFEMKLYIFLYFISRYAFVRCLCISNLIRSTQTRDNKSSSPHIVCVIRTNRKKSETWWTRQSDNYFNFFQQLLLEPVLSILSF